VLKKVWNGISAVLVFVVVILAILLAGARLAGVQPYAVLSGSMSPAYPVGALIYVKSAQPQEVRVGDPITFYLDDGATVATHRVIQIDAENGCFHTKGDANESPDGAPVYVDQLIGIPIFSIPLLGYFSNFIATPPGLYIVITAVLAIVLLTFCAGLFKKAGEEDARRATGGGEAVRKYRKKVRSAFNINNPQSRGLAEKEQV
jgi:signal peptidase